MSDFEQTTALNPQFGQAWDQKAALLLKLQRYAEALAALDKVDELMPEGPLKTPVRIVYALVALKTGNATRALAVLDDAVANDPNAENEPRFIQTKADILLRLGKGIELETLFKKASQNPELASNVGFRSAWANALLIRGKVSEATEIFKGIAAQKPVNGDANAWLSHGSAVIIFARFEEALESFARALALDPNLETNPQFLTMQMLCLSGTGRHEEALKAGLAASSLDPADAIPRVFCGIAYAGLGRYNEALGEVEEAIKLSQGTSLSELYKGIAFIQKGWILLSLTKWDEAHEAFGQGALFAANNPLNRIAALVGKGMALYARSEVATTADGKTSDRDAALAIANQAVELSADIPDGPISGLAWWSKGNILSLLERNEGALSAYLRAAKCHPTLPRIQLSLAETFERLGQDENAAAAFLEASNTGDSADEKSDAWLGRGRTLHRLKQYEEALYAYRRVIADDDQEETSTKSPQPVNRPAGNHPTRLASLLGQGAVLIAMKRPDEALTIFTKAAEHAQSIGDLRNRIAALARVGLLIYWRSTKESGNEAEASQKEALKIASEAARLSLDLTEGPDRGFAFWLQGNVLSWLGRHEEALLAYERAKQYQADLGGIQLSLGEAYERLQEYEQAETTFATAAKVSTSSPQKFEAWLGKGRVLHRLQRYEDALQACREAISECGENEEILVLLGTTYSSLGRHEAAQLTFRRGWRLGKPNNRSAGCALGVSASLLALERNEESRTFLEQAEKETNIWRRTLFQLWRDTLSFKEHAPCREGSAASVENGDCEGRRAGR